MKINKLPFSQHFHALRDEREFSAVPLLFISFQIYTLIQLTTSQNYKNFCLKRDRSSSAIPLIIFDTGCNRYLSPITLGLRQDLLYSACYSKASSLSAFYCFTPTNSSLKDHTIATIPFPRI